MASQLTNIKSILFIFRYFYSFRLGIFDPVVYAQFNYPVARTVPFDTLIYRTKLIDEYAWMSRPENEKEMLEFARLQGELTKSILDSITGTEILIKVLNTIEESYSPEEISVKGTQGNQLYYSKQVQEKSALFKRDGLWVKKRKLWFIPLLFIAENIELKNIALPIINLCSP